MSGRDGTVAGTASGRFAKGACPFPRGAGGAAPTPVGGLVGRQAFQAPPGSRLVDLATVAIGQQHPAGAVNRVLLVRLMLVAEPERQPASVGLLAPGKIVEAAAHGPIDPAPAVASPIRGRPAPGGQGADRMGRQVGAAAIEGQRAPAAAERGPAAVAILEVQEPLHAGPRRLDGLGPGSRAGPVGRSTCRASKAPAVSSASGTAPLESLQPQPPGSACVNGCTWRCWQLRSQSRASPTCQVLACRGQGVDRQGGVPGGKVGVDGPGAVGPGRVEEKLHAAARRPGARARPVAARLITTKLVSGAASRNPPLAGCMRSSTARLRRIAIARTSRTSGLRGGR